jgi:hypothetical protein
MFDLNSISQKFLQAPHISKYIKESIEKRLDRGFKTRQIYEEHKKFCFNAQVSRIKASRDYYFNMKSVWYYENKMKRGI